MEKKLFEALSEHGVLAIFCAILLYYIWWKAKEELKTRELDRLERKENRESHERTVGELSQAITNLNNFLRGRGG